MYSNQYVDNMSATYEKAAREKDAVIDRLRLELEGHATQEGKITDLMIQATALRKERDAAREAATEARDNLDSAVARALRAERSRDSYKQTINEWAEQAGKDREALALQGQEIARLIGEKQKMRKLLRATRRFIKATL